MVAVILSSFLVKTLCFGYYMILYSETEILGALISFFLLSCQVHPMDINKYHVIDGGVGEEVGLVARKCICLI